MSLKRRIVMWRHGRTTWNAEHRFQGQQDIDLDSTGMEQARNAAKQLALLRPARIISSDLRRAAMTAQSLADLCDHPVITDPGLRETFAGEWEGKTWSELLAQHGDDLNAWAAGSNLRPGGGETRTEVADRVIAAIDRQLETLAARDTLVVVTHGGSARGAISQLIGLPPEHWAALGVLTNCAWSVLTEKDSPYGPPWRLQEYNAGSLPAPALSDDR